MVTGQRVRFQRREEVDKGDLTKHEGVFTNASSTEIWRDSPSPCLLPLLPFHFIALLSGGQIVLLCFVLKHSCTVWVIAALFTI